MLMSGLKEDQGVEGNETTKTGWGGFPLLANEGGKSDIAAGAARTRGDPGKPMLREKSEANKSGLLADASLAIEVPPIPVTDDIDRKPKVIAPTDIIGEPSLLGKEDPNAEYFHLAQQALTVAALGGIFSAHRVQKPEEHIKDDENDAEDDDIADYHDKGQKAEKALASLPPIGKSLFLSLHVVTWEVDPEVVLEVGWSAVWWQENVQDAMIRNGEASAANINDPPQFEEMRDRGHFM